MASKNTPQVDVRAALDEWASLQKQRERVEAARDKALAPFKAEYERQAAPVVIKADAKLAPLAAKITDLEARIGELMRGLLPEGETTGRVVETDGAAAEISVKTEREINPQLFFKTVREASRGPAFWACVKILVGKAEGFLSGKLDGLATIKATTKVAVRLKT